MQIYAMDGTVCVDVSEGVKALYDLAVMGNSYGSGFWTYEDAAPVLKLAKMMGWGGVDSLQKYADDQLFMTERMAFLRDNGLTGETCMESYREQMSAGYQAAWGIEMFTCWRVKQHEHVYATVGRCMWYGCEAREQAGDVPG